MFYKLNASRVTLREFWWETKLFVWVGLIVKLSRMRIRGSSDDLAVDSLRPFLVDESKIPPEMLARFAPTLQQLHTLGFGRAVWHDETDLFQATNNTLATLLHENGRSWVRVQCRTNFARVPAKIKFFTTFISRTPGGFIATGNGKYDMAWPKTHDTVRFRHATIDEIWRHHQARMTPAVQAVTQQQLLDVAEEYHTTLRDFHLARAVFEQLTDEEFALYPAPPSPAGAPTAMPQVNMLPGIDLIPAAAASFTAPPPIPSAALPPPIPPPDLLEIATLDELRKLQNRKVNWGSSIALLLLSAGLFVLTTHNSDKQQDWRYIAMIMGILLFHELGHYVAMKYFGYRNLRMFFIPGFGAAVSGRHYNAPAWKKMIVSLMGPLPGILVGSVLLMIGPLLHREILYQIGLFAIIINVFNLIPILPFDGGWVAHAALFSRHPKLDVGFRVVAILGLAGLGFFVPGMHILLYIALASVLALPLAHRLATIVGKLRRVPGIGASPDNQTIPPESARIILASIRRHFRLKLTARLAAQHIASVFESLNARPPSAGATAGLLSLHAAGFLFAISFGIAGMAMHGNNPFGHSRVAGHHVINAEHLASSGPSPSGPRNIVIVRFKTDHAADGVFAAMPPQRSCVRFGQTLLLSFAPPEISDQRDAFSTYGKIAADIFVESSKMRAAVDLTFQLPDTPAGRQTAEDLDLYFQGSGWRLIPPWASDVDWPAEQRQAQTTIRRMIKALQTPPPTGGDERKKLSQQLTAAQRSGDTAEVDRIQAQFKQSMTDSRLKLHEQLLQEYGRPDLIETWTDIESTTKWSDRQARFGKEIAPQLGQWPTDKPDDFLVAHGYMSKSEPHGINLYGQFAHTDTGLIFVMRWLFAQGATDVHYSIRGTPALSIPDDGNGE